MKSRAKHNLLFGLSLLLLVLSQATSTFAQEPLPTPQPTPLTAPPPLKTIPKAERAQLVGAGDPKQRLRLTIELSGTHLGLAEKNTSDGNYETASAEVGMYHALIEDALTFLGSLKRDSNKTRDLYKRLELSLRADGPRLTAMRRITPIEFAVWIKQAEDFARQGRTEALNSFFGHTVVREPEDAGPDKPNDEAKQPPTPKSDQP